MPRAPIGDTGRALLLASLAAVCFGAMAFSAKLASAHLSGSEVAFLRFALMLTPLLWPPILRRSLVVQRLDLLFYRGLFGGLAVLFYFLAIEHVSVGLATLLNYSAPIWSVPIAARYLNERIDQRFLLPMAIAALGLILVVRGQTPANLPLIFGPWAWVGLISAVFSGAAVASLRAARRSENSWSIYTSFSVCGLLVTLPFALASWRTPTAKEALLLAAVGATSIGAQLGMTHAYRWVTNLQMGVCTQLAVVIAMALGVAFLGEPATPVGLAGSALTIGSILAVVAIQATPRAVE
ncbi:MAG TPA: DMT family transporter [Thermoanaerobaculia bacterium]|jgi:drug/metabolite transporter (DMT)-like permease|nr:DMT family transporter [Thermoanaerobaculia bacterium]